MSPVMHDFTILFHLRDLNLLNSFFQFYFTNFHSLVFNWKLLILPFTCLCLPPTAEHSQGWPSVLSLRGIYREGWSLSDTTANTTSFYLYILATVRGKCRHFKPQGQCYAVGSRLGDNMVEIFCTEVLFGTEKHNPFFILLHSVSISLGSLGDLQIQEPTRDLERVLV